MLDEMQEGEEGEEEDHCSEKIWTNNIMLDEMQEEEEEDKSRLRKKKNNNIHTRKLSYRSSEGRSSSRRFRKCRTYEGEIVQNRQNCGYSYRSVLQRVRTIR